eukprot:scaffold211807_cov26-Tisochrysis_lutea.AAC.4
MLVSTQSTLSLFQATVAMVASACVSVLVTGERSEHETWVSVSSTKGCTCREVDARAAFHTAPTRLESLHRQVARAAPLQAEDEVRATAPAPMLHFQTVCLKKAARSHATTALAQEAWTAGMAQDAPHASHRTIERAVVAAPAAKASAIPVA